MTTTGKIFKILLLTLVLFCIIGCQNNDAVKELKELKARIKIEAQRLETNKAIVRRAHDEVWSKGNMSIIDQLYSPDYVAHWVMGGDTGLDQFKQMLTQTRTTFPDLTEKIVHIVAEKDLVVTHFITSGTFKGPLNGMPPNGKSGSRPEIAVHRIKNGKIVEQWTVADLMSLMNQLDIKM